MTGPARTWIQPVGEWRARGAGPGLVRIGLGLDPNGLDISPDDTGRGVWHYWSESPAPERSMKRLATLHGPARQMAIAHNGEHPLHKLALHGHLVALRWWHDQVGWPSEALGRQPDGMTPLLAAAWNGEIDVLRLLVEAQPDHINATDIEGRSAVIVAVHRAGAEGVRILVEAGADLNLRDAQGKSAVQHCAQYGDPGWVCELLDMGGRSGESDADQLVKHRQFLPEAEREQLRTHWWQKFIQRRYG